MYTYTKLLINCAYNVCAYIEKASGFKHDSLMSTAIFKNVDMMQV